MTSHDDQQDPSTTAEAPSGIPGVPETSGIPAVPPGAPVSGYQPTVPSGPVHQAPVYQVPSGPPQLWLRPGPYLPRRTWQEKTRSAITAITGVTGVLWLIGLAAIVIFGFLFSHYQKTAAFTGSGGVIVNCSSSSTAGGTVSAGTPVVAWSDRSDKVLRTKLGKVKRTEIRDPQDLRSEGVTRCYLPFTFDKLRRDAAGYNIRIGDTATQFVTSKSLKEGAIVPMVVGGDR